MFKSQSEFSSSMFGSFAYDPIIARHEDHLLVRMNKLIDWSFVENEVSDCYSTQGQKAYHPVLLLKLLVIQQLYDLSERDTCTNTDCNLIFRYFVGLGLDQEAPHWTELGKFKNRLGTERFENLFYCVLEEAERLGIVISNQRIVDTTDIQANVDLSRCAKGKKDEDDKEFIDRGTSDPEAAFGNKGLGRKKWYGYKNGSNLDPISELITAVETTDASVPDVNVMVPLIDKELDHRGEDAIRKQGGDKGFVGKTEELKKRNILDYIIPRDNMKKEKTKKDRNNHYLHLKHLRYKIERKQSEAKNPHGLKKARYRGRWKVHLQGLLTYMVINLKRVTNTLLPITA